MSSPEWAASDSNASEPENSPAASLSSVIAAAASIECKRHPPLFSGKPGYFEASEIIRVSGYSIFRNSAGCPNAPCIFRNRCVANKCSAPIFRVFCGKVGTDNTHANLSEIKSLHSPRTNAPCPSISRLLCEMGGKRKLIAYMSKKMNSIITALPCTNRRCQI